MTGPIRSRLQSYLDDFDHARLGAFHVRLLIVVGLCWMWAGLGVSTVGFILPALRADWGLSSGQQGLVASAGLVGMMAGAILAGGLSDRIGRRTTLALDMIWLGVFSVLGALAGNYPVLLVLRLLTGFGLGAVLPLASTLVSEYSPIRYRGSLLVLLNGFWGLGGGLAALVGYELVGQYGWRPALFFSGLSILSAPMVWWLIPESMRFLIGHGKLEDALATAHHIDIRPDQTGVPYVRQPTQPMVPAGPQDRPWSPAYLGRTASLWLLWFALNFTFQGVFVWLPSLLIAGGSSLSQSYLLSLAISLGQVPGTLLAALLADRASRRLTMSLTMVFWGIAVVLFGFGASPAWVLVWGCLLALGNGAAWVGLSLHHRALPHAHARPGDRLGHRLWPRRGHPRPARGRTADPNRGRQPAHLQLAGRHPHPGHPRPGRPAPLHHRARPGRDQPLIPSL
jgi:MFS transporter, putative metabolite:H+ symporter